MIKLEGVSKIFKGDVVALKNATAEIQRGEFVFLVGPSGSGKSTFIRLLNREEVADSGRIMVAGKDVGSLSSWKVPYLRRNIGYIFQDYKLLPKKTVYENVAFGLEVIGRPRQVVRQQVPAILELVGLTRKAERLPGNVNSGKRNVSSKKVTYAHTRITEEALSFIERNKAKPFYLNLTWTIPHTNNEAGHVEKNGQEVPDHGIYEGRDWPDPEKGFAAMVTLMDEDTGKIIDLLKKLGIDDNTLVVFTSDNGPHQEGGHKVDFFDSNGKLKGHKRSLHDGGIRVPMIAWWPGTVKPGVTDLPSAFWDWLPTACELGGAEIPAGIDGISFAPTLLGKSDQQKKHEYLFWRWSRFRAVRMGSWKGVQTNKTLALYELKKDIGEEKDVASKHPDIAAKIKKIIAELE